MTREREIVISLIERKEKRKYLYLLEDYMFKGVNAKIIKALKEGVDFELGSVELFRMEGLTASEVSQIYIDCTEYYGWLNEQDYIDYGLKIREQKAIGLAKVGQWRKAVKYLKVEPQQADDWDFYYRYLEETRKNSAKIDFEGYQGYPTGIKKLDDNTSGLIPKKIWVIGGYNAYGKTYLMTNIANKLICSSCNVCVLSLEMSREDIINRLIAERIERGVFELAKRENEEYVKREYEAIKESLQDRSLILVDNIRELSEITAFLRRENRRKKLDVVFLDFIQLVGDKDSQGSYEKTRNVCITLQALAQELGVCMVLLSQVSNESVSNSSDLYGFKGAGEIGQIADVAIRIERTKENGELTPYYGIVVVKNRSGRGGEIECRIDFPSGHITQA